MAGRIEVITGCMYSGKTEELINRLESSNDYSVIKSSNKPENKVVSHDGRVVEAISVSSDDSLDSIIEEIGDVDVVGLDEVNLYGDKALEICRRLLYEDYRVIVSGLDMDFRGEPFYPIPQLLSVADDVTKLKATCDSCGGVANVTQRLINGRPASYDDSTILVGGDEVYLPACRDCHVVSK
jgi:thymidine kinase